MAPVGGVTGVSVFFFANVVYRRYVCALPVKRAGGRGRMCGARCFRICARVLCTTTAREYVHFGAVSTRAELN